MGDLWTQGKNVQNIFMPQGRKYQTLTLTESLRRMTDQVIVIPSLTVKHLLDLSSLMDQRLKFY